MRLSENFCWKNYHPSYEKADLLNLEIEMEKKVVELNFSVANLRDENAALDEKLAKESSEKLVSWLLSVCFQECKVLLTYFQI